jgi:thymidylate synthase
MNKADKYMYENIKNILTNGYWDKNPRPHYPDGEPAHTKSVNHVVRTYDLAKGEFPICNLRPQAWKTGIKEIFAIYQNQSNKVSEFERCGCGWWGDWALEDGTIGKAYPYNLESHRPNEMKRTVCRVPVRIVDDKYKELITVSFPRVDCNDMVYCDRYKVVGVNTELTDNKHVYYDIMFLSNGYVGAMRKDLIGKSNGTNPYDRTVYGVGYLGEYNKVKNFTEEEVFILKDKWENMLRRCYSTSYKKDHPSYEGMFVHQDWHSFAQFLEDVRMLPQYFLAKEENFSGWDLDKDYYGSNAYSKDTCVFLKHSENTLYAKRGGCYKITDTTNNVVYYEINISDFARMIDVQPKSINKAINKNNKYRNFTFEYCKNTREYVYRYELSRNQVVGLIKDIQSNPYGRRHIISFWHWANIDKKSLVECAYETIWNVRNDENDVEYLDMCLVQRSGDMLMASGAGGINEIQYAAFLMMIARHCGLLPGVFTHLVVNEQLYSRHMDAADKMLRRYSELLDKDRELKMAWEDCYQEDAHKYETKNPMLILNPEKTNFYEFTIDDFAMENYTPMKPQINLEIGI